jgi:6,7-dimethyl-8-ribityllumazine synthase
MPETISARLDAGPHQYALVISRWNNFITERLADGATDALVRHGCSADRITRVYVPGSFELPLAAQKLAASGRYAAVVCLGCLIRGETDHYEYLAAEVTRGVAQVMLTSGVPIGFGVVTADSLEQAIDRCGGKHGNKGAEAALAAIEMVQVLHALSR